MRQIFITMILVAWFGVYTEIAESRAVEGNIPAQKESGHSLNDQEEEEIVLPDLRSNPDYFVKMCHAKMGLVSRESINKSQERAFATILANFFSLAMDNKGMRSNSRCMLPVDSFDTYVRRPPREGSNTSLFSAHYLDKLFQGQNSSAFVTYIDKDGIEQRGRLDCHQIISQDRPDLFEKETTAIDNTVRRLMKAPKKLQTLLNEALNPKGDFSSGSSSKVTVQDIEVDPSSKCLNVTTLSSKKDGGYGHGRYFKVCENLGKTTCGDYFDEEQGHQDNTNGIGSTGNN